MQAYIKSFAAFRTLLQRDALSYSLCLDSVEREGSTVTVVGQDIPRSYAGSWLIIDGTLYVIDTVTPQEGRTLIALLHPGEAFSRKLPYTPPAEGVTIGGFIAATLMENWQQQADGVYAIPYMSVSNMDNVPFIEPSTDDYGLFSLAEYIRTVRRLRGVRTEFAVSGDTMTVRILDLLPESHAVVFDDGHSQLETAAYSRSGAAKVTTVHAQAEGNPVLQDWYLSDSGTVTTAPPPVRATGEWLVIGVKAKDDPQIKAEEQFAKNAESHKIEFWSDRQLHVLDNCTFRVHGEVLSSYISYKGRRSTDGRWFYRSGELATTATEKLKGVINA